MNMRIAVNTIRMNGLFLWISFFLLATAAPGTEAERKIPPDDPYFKFQVSYDHRGGNVVVDQTSRKKSSRELTLATGIHLNLLPAWELTTGCRDVVVAVMDDGFFYEHEDIRDNIWKNIGESGLDSDGYPKETNGIDDDRNGYIDDVMGWDFWFKDPDPDAYIYDGRFDTAIAPNWHSIDALGIIGAKGNNGLGVSGVNWDVSLMLLKVAAQGSALDKDPAARVPKAAEAIRYAVDNGARVINWSGFVSVTDADALRPLKEAIDYAEQKNVLLVVAAGNSKKNIDLAENVLYPACFPNENIIVVGEIDFDGEPYVVRDDPKFVGGSNFGPKNVDIAAIAQNYTTHIYHNRSTYHLAEGTSNAAPVVSGVAALILSLRPDLKASQLKQILMDSAVRLPGLQGKIGCGGMVDAYAALKKAVVLEKPSPKAPRQASSSAVFSSGVETIDGWWISSLAWEDESSAR